VVELHGAFVYGVTPYDHAHFLRDFRSLVGITPAAYESQTLSG
jgi:hypothetical protein